MLGYTIKALVPKPALAIRPAHCTASHKGADNPELAVKVWCWGYPIPHSSIQLSHHTIRLVDRVLAASANYSWEIGTRETALLELKSPKYFLYHHGSSIPPPRLKRTWDEKKIAECFQSVDNVLATRPAGIQTFFQDSAVGDPASVGIPFLIKNATMAHPSSSTNYSIATQQELDHLLAVPRENSTGAISQREPPEPIQIWADFVAMAPPFIAYYGAIHKNQSLLQLAYDQVAAYRTLLLDSNVGLLQHIVLGGGTGSPPQDHGHWSTGNAWFLTGLLRVERIIFLSPFRRAMAKQRATLLRWALELTDTASGYIQEAEIAAARAADMYASPKSSSPTRPAPAVAATSSPASTPSAESSAAPVAESSTPAPNVAATSSPSGEVPSATAPKVSAEALNPESTSTPADNIPVTPQTKAPSTSPSSSTSSAKASKASMKTKSTPKETVVAPADVKVTTPESSTTPPSSGDAKKTK
ncbi:hypothetical protein DL93DRAFT_2154320 [Clavulina sp. PMI_390]|nr:hypothetical protein DL93DRAFT_2154320 [Clavulina sp. PMI_390]